MSEPYIGEIKMFGGSFAPRGWAFCDGQLLSISSNTALFALLRTTYGGDGRTTMGLPDLRGRSPKHKGSGAGLKPVRLGQFGGRDSVLLTKATMPSHDHKAVLYAEDGSASNIDPEGNLLAKEAIYKSPRAAKENKAMSSESITIMPEGGNQPFDNLSPYLGVNFIIALEGIFPPRS